MKKIYFTVVALCLIAVSYVGLTYEKNLKIENHLKEKTIQYKQNYNVIYEEYKKISNVIYQIKINTPELKEIFKNAKSADNKQKVIIRDKLYKYLSDSYKILKEQNIKQLHFHLPNNESFLRFHRPGKFGDDLTNIRGTVKYVNEYKKAIDGFEEGRIYNGYRFVFPIVHQKEHLGSVEISFSTFAMNIEMIKSFDLIGKLLISKSVVKEKVFSDEKSNYKQSKFEDFLFEKKISEIVQRYNKKNISMLISDETKEEVNKKAFENRSFSLYDTKSKTIMTFLKVQNPVSNKVVGMLVLRSEPSYIQSKMNNFYIMFIGISLFILLFVLFIYRILNQKETLNILVEEKTKTLNDINRELEESEYELQLLNESLEQRVQEEIAKNSEKERMLYEQTKMAALGEMIGNIAHQWRQPLSLISTIASSIQLNHSFGMTISQDELDKNMEEIVSKANYLSMTIDDFRNFIRGESKEEMFNLKESISSFYNIVESSIKKNNINVVLDIDKSIEVHSLKNELNQCFINLFNNAKDAFEDKKYPKYIFISASMDKNNLIIKFKDNAGGIPENILTKVFEPYFTTKHQSQGTGLGLNMTYRLITEGIGGTISVSNDVYNIGADEYTGAEFIITLSDI
ncbi:MAG: ATP-binding protein [Campylobacterota bacterium]|nr:ATP-binding protein [Campylobacterota bacterium]